MHLSENAKNHIDRTVERQKNEQEKAIVHKAMNDVDNGVKDPPGMSTLAKAVITTILPIPGIFLWSEDKERETYLEAHKQYTDKKGK